MEDLIAFLIALIMLGFGALYSYKVFKGQTKPALSTWLIMFVGTALSLLTYLSASNWNFVGGILNLLDVTVTIIIIAATLLWSKSKIKFRAFEKGYLVIAGLIALFWLLTKNPFEANLLVQVLILVGYFPTIQKLVTEKQNTESFSAWLIAYSAGLLALFPAIVSGGILPLVYVGRTIVMQSAIIGLMIYYGKPFGSRKAKKN
ncbi:MAG: hypothetical protein V1493_06010 [Candidatus Diapherotrites archaeon]